jgi:hypothetical protein
MVSHRFRFAPAVGALLLAASASAQVPRSFPPAKYTKVIEVDSGSADAPSLSPNGRWIVYSGGPENTRNRNIWIVPATGGAPKQLTLGDYIDDIPVWFPGSDRILFLSTRTDRALMTMGVNPATGEALEPPHRLTLEAVGDHYAVSPDGRWVVYGARTNTGPGPLKIIPAAGGNARILDSITKAGDAFLSPSFTKDGRFVEYIHADSALGETIRRVPVGGGPVETVAHGSPGTLLRYANGVIADVIARHDTVWLQNLRGDTVGMFTIRGLWTRPPIRHVRFTSSPDVMLASTVQGSVDVHVLPIDGGTPRVVRAGRGDYTGGFLGDGSVIVTTQTGIRSSIDVFAPRGGISRHIALPDSEIPEVATTDGRLVYWRRGPVRGVYETANATSRVLSRDAVGGGAGSGVDYRARLTSKDEYPFVERTPTGVRIVAWSPVQHRLRTVKEVAGRAVDFALHGALMAYVVMRADSATVFVESGNQTPQRIAVLRARHTDGIGISDDGRHVAFAAQVIRESDTSHVIGFADLDGNGAPTGQTRFVPVDNVTGLTWLPNNREILYESINQSIPITTLVRLGREEGASPRVISQQEHVPFYDFVLSPDGRWVSYPTQPPAHKAIWRVDLPGLENRARR